MATTRRPVAAPPVRASMERPRPRSPLGTPPPTPGRNTQAPDPYGSKPNPNGPSYPWSVGGTSKEVGVPDNWADFYPTIGHGRGDAWISNKEQLGRERELQHPGQPDVFLSVHDRQFAQQNPEFARLHPEALSGNPKDRITQPQYGPPRPHDGSQADFDWVHKYGIWTGNPEQAWSFGNRSGSGLNGPPWDPKHPPPGMTVAKWWEQNPGGLMPGPHNTMIPADANWTQGDTYSNSGQSPAPPAPPGTAIHQPGQPPPGTGPGSAQAWNRLGAASQKTAAPAAAVDYGKIRSGMKPGQTVKQGGKSYFLNQNGALVDVTNPAARKRITDRQGNLIGQAAAPPPPGTTPPPQTEPQARVPIGNQPPPQQQPPTMPINGPPFNYSNFSNSLMQGMGGGGGYGMPQSYYPDAQMMGGYGGGFQGRNPAMLYGGGGYGGDMMPQMQNFMQGMMGGMGGYGMPMSSNGMMDYGGYPAQMMGGYGNEMMQGMGYGDPYGGMGFDPNMMNQSLMGYF